ncbi:phosphoglycerate dehydrogenase [Brevundimonas sp.]|uniref:phosphoglycerate dehydrogenase n=1 Tax=Brevundimonas sp. TaxID=1871086 RepID=UPI0025EF2741|nr:phosphoglycerate dehydrogenase [Brevundimonas sp.]
MADRVLVTCPPMLGLIDRFRDRFAERGIELDAAPVVQTLSEAELIERLPRYDGWIAGDDPANARTLGAGVQGRLRAVVKWGVGVDNVDFEAAKALGLNVVNTPQVFGREVADVAMAYVLGLARETYRIDREIRLNNTWPKPPGVSTWNKTAAVVGFGDIGRQTAKRLLACDMKVIAYDPFFAPFEGVEVEGAEWPQRLEEADFLVFTCPLNAATRHMFNASILPRLKPGVRIVNVSRGPVIDETALLEGLNSGLIHSAALDVFEDEPLAPDNPLRAFDRCIFGSHNGSNTADAVERVSHVAIDKLFALLDAAPPKA